METRMETVMEWKTKPLWSHSWTMVVARKGIWRGKNNDETETKNYMVSQLDNVSSTCKGMKKWNINVTYYQPKREENGIRWNGWRFFVLFSKM
jgi:hypothetical protein